MYARLAVWSLLEEWLTYEITHRLLKSWPILSLPLFPLLLLIVAARMPKLGLGYWGSPIVKTKLRWTTMIVLVCRRSCDFKGGHRSETVKLLLLAVWWSVNLVMMKTGYIGRVLGRQLVHPTMSGWDGIWMMKSAWYARRVVYSGWAFVLRESSPVWSMKLRFGSLLSSWVEPLNCRCHNSSIARRTGLFVDSGSWDL